VLALDFLEHKQRGGPIAVVEIFRGARIQQRHWFFDLLHPLALGVATDAG
jgi:hypothetical protein